MFYFNVFSPKMMHRIISQIGDVYVVIRFEFLLLKFVVLKCVYHLPLEL